MALEALAGVLGIGLVITLLVVLGNPSAGGAYPAPYSGLLAGYRRMAAPPVPGRAPCVPSSTSRPPASSTSCWSCRRTPSWALPPPSPPLAASSRRRRGATHAAPASASTRADGASDAGANGAARPSFPEPATAALAEIEGHAAKEVAHDQVERGRSGRGQRPQPQAPPQHPPAGRARPSHGRDLPRRRRKRKPKAYGARPCARGGK